VIVNVARSGGPRSMAEGLRLTRGGQPRWWWPRGLALLAGILLALGVSAAQVPGPWHEDDAPHACPICKLGCQPVPLAPVSALVEPPAPPRPFIASVEQPACLLDTGSSSPSRAPPA
jgi:hypothetical protein